MIDLRLLATLAGILVLAVFLAGLVDIGRNGPSPRMLSRSHRAKVGAKDTSTPLFAVLLAVAGVLVVSGAVSIGADDNGPNLRFTTEPLAELIEGAGR